MENNDPVLTDETLKQIRCGTQQPVRGDIGLMMAVEILRLREQVQRMWIPVSERLPEVEKLYLTLNEDGWPSGDYLGADGTWLSGNVITHWQPLPPAPKGGE